MQNLSTALTHRNTNRFVDFPIANAIPVADHPMVLDAEIVREGVTAIQRLIASERASSCRNRDAIENAQYLLDEIASLVKNPTRPAHRTHHVMFACGIAAVSRLIALHMNECSPDLDTIARASWLTADIANLVEAELELDC